MEFPPQLSGCCWEREIGFSNIVLHSWVAAHSVTTLPFSCRMGFLWLVQPHTALPLAKFLFLSPMHSNSYIFFSNGMVVSPLWKVGLLQKLFHLGVYPNHHSSHFSWPWLREALVSLQAPAGSTCSPDWGQSVYCLMHRWVRLLLGLLPQGAVSYNYHRCTFIHGWMQH